MLYFMVTLKNIIITSVAPKWVIQNKCQFMCLAHTLYFIYGTLAVLFSNKFLTHKVIGLNCIIFFNIVIFNVSFSSQFFITN